MTSRIRIVFVVVLSVVVFVSCGGGGGGSSGNAGTIGFGSASFAARENGDVVTPITLRRTGGSKGRVSVVVTSHDGSASSDPSSLVEPVDYAAVTTIVTFEDGDSADKVVEFPAIVHDGLPEQDEGFEVQLSDATGGAAIDGARATAAVALLDDDDVLCLTAQTPAGGELFGRVVVRAGQRLAVTAPARGSGTGAVDVFDLTSGARVAELTNPTPVAPGPWPFGAALAADGNSLAVSSVGAVHLFDVTNIALVATLPGAPATGRAIGLLADGVVSPDLSPTVLKLIDRATGAVSQSLPVVGNVISALTCSLATNGSTMLLGLPHGGAQVTSPGLVRVLAATPIAVTMQIDDPAQQPGSRFGWTVAYYGEFLVVGANGDSGVAPQAGAIHVFDATTGALVRTVTSPAPVTDGKFGNALATVGPYLAVQEAGGGPSATGRVYVFDGSFDVVKTIDDPAPASTVASPGSFGKALAELDGTLCIGAMATTVDGHADAGAVYLVRPN